MNSDQELLRKTMKTVGVMLGALTLFMGTLTILVLVIVGHAVGPRPSSTDEGSKAVPTSNVHGGKPTEAEPPARPRTGVTPAEGTPRPDPPPPGPNRATDLKTRAT
jgi:hypothetical protein